MANRLLLGLTSGWLALAATGAAASLLPPQVVLLSAPRTASIGVPFSVSASTSAAPGSSGVVAAGWNFGDGSPVVAGTTATHTYQRPGNFFAVFEARSAEGGAAAFTTPILVAQTNPPSVLLNFATRSAMVGEPVTFRATATAGSPFSSIVQTIWDFGDGSPTVNASTATHRYTVPGDYVARFTAISNEGLRSTLSTGVQISPFVAPPITVSAPHASGLLAAALAGLALLARRRAAG
jgi:PKD repeat protein